jgi:hypothetical protein
LRKDLQASPRSALSQAGEDRVERERLEDGVRLEGVAGIRKLSELVGHWNPLEEGFSDRGSRMLRHSHASIEEALDGRALTLRL